MLFLYFSYFVPQFPEDPSHFLALYREQYSPRYREAETLLRQLPIAEAQDLLGDKYVAFLLKMCCLYAHPRAGTFVTFPRKAPALALPYAEALVRAQPAEDKGYQIRAYCRAHSGPLDARHLQLLLADYTWLANRPLCPASEWRAQFPYIDAEAAERLANEDRYYRTHFYLACAWTQYRLGDEAAADEAFARAFAEPPTPYGFDPEWPADLLPPIADPAYLRWQIERQYRHHTRTPLPEAAQDWLGLAWRTLQVI